MIDLKPRELPACPLCGAPGAVYFEHWNLYACGRCTDRPMTREEVDAEVEARSNAYFDERPDFFAGCDPAKMPDPTWIRGETEVREWREALPVLLRALPARLAVRAAYHWGLQDTALGRGRVLTEIDQAASRVVRPA